MMLNSFLDKFMFTKSLRYVHNNFYLVNLPFLMVPAELLAALAVKGDAELDREIYYSVKTATRKSLIRQFDLDFGLQGESGLNLVEQFFTASGWGGINRIDLDSKESRAIVVVTNSQVAQLLKQKANLPVDHFLRGVFAGIYSDFFKEDVECVETDCLALNKKECRFVLKPLHDFDFSKKPVRGQLNVK